MILWRFGPENSLIARINGVAKDISVYADVLDGRFRDRLQVNNQTGDLIITNITTQHTGLYNRTISGKQKISYRVNVIVYDEVKSVLVKQRDSVTLHTHLTEIQKDDVIVWRFGLQKSLIAKINGATSETLINDDVLDGRFRDRLMVNDQTGDLTIMDTKTKDSGLYEMIINSAKESSYRFNVTVYDFLPLPVITRDSSQCSSSSSSSNCVLLCSVLNVRDVSLSWYKGNSLLSSISVTYLNIRLSLPLEVEYQDTNTYRCVVNNAIKNLTQHLNINELCKPCSGCVCCCHDFEAVIRLVLSALVGVAAVAILVYDIRSSRVEQKKRSQTSSDY
ncbi:SLAM family member 5-like [Paramisgurnus dabryanus]|uniref:SLAM family member 5-like n=1 Tax=Paramisgurnus dabryanus TaxID=90735 RepID=UPI0031F3C74A